MLTSFTHWGLALSLLALAACPAYSEEAPKLGSNEDRIAPYTKNPRYWQYKRKPVMLIGGSNEDNLFQCEDVKEQLDLLASLGGNYVRNTMSSRDDGSTWPFHRREDGKYDLEQLNEVYFERFARFLQLAYERDVIVQIELWDRFDYARDEWLHNPYRPANNVNYTVESGKLKNEYPRHPGSNDNPFFRSVPELENREMLLRYQQSQVDRLLEISLPYPNVLYCMDNETGADPAWGAYWSRYIKNKAKGAGVSVQTTEMWDAWDLRHPQHRHTLDHPELYSFVDTSQNNHNKGREHWNNLQWVRAYIGENPRPINHVKDYGADTGKYGDNRDGIERFWRCILGGAASIRFHRPDSGLGLKPLAQPHIKSGQMLVSVFDVFRAIPDGPGKRLKDAEDNEAYLMYVPGEAYAVYFPKGGETGLDLTDASGTFQVKWLNTATAEWREAPAVQAGTTVSLNAPDQGHWVAVVSKK
ncbi:MAG: hypothetical protein R6V12_17315 [Candidatus Hydrogenedentota bacterium]